MNKPKRGPGRPRKDKPTIYHDGDTFQVCRIVRCKGGDYIALTYTLSGGKVVDVKASSEDIQGNVMETVEDTLLEQARTNEAVDPKTFIPL